MEKQLPLGKPSKICYQYLTFPLSIAILNNSFANWFHSQFIQLYTLKDAHEYMHLQYHHADGDRYEPLEIIEMLENRLMINESLIDFYKMCINNNYYIWTYCDKKYIPDYELDVSFFHDLLIYGYNESKNVFLVYGYIGNYLKQYEVKFRDFLNSYYSTHINDIPARMALYSLKKDQLKINMVRIKWHLLDYMEGVNTVKREEPHDYPIYKSNWGINIYPEIECFCELHIQTNKRIPINTIYCLYEHKRDMVSRIKHLSEQAMMNYTDEILEKFKNIETEAFCLVNLIIKVTARGYKQGDLNRIKLRIDKIKKMEIEALSKYVDYNEKILKNI